MFYLKQKIIILLIIIIFFLFPGLTAARHFSSSLKPSSPKQKTIKAYRINTSIVIDGILSEEAWQKNGVDEFTQSDPIDGEKPSEKTEVWIAYDDEAIYVAARLYDSSPEEITSRLGRRDDFVESDWFIFALDPYYDRRSGFMFAVNPAGSICDWTLYNDVNRDSTWDGIWDWAARIDNKGWTVEIRIPFDQLRFPRQEQYIWGVNFERRIQRKHERNTFVWVPKGDTGYVSHFAQLEGISGIKSGLHLEIWPYTVGQARLSPEEPGNPFQTRRQYLGNIGMDLKFGVKSNLTIDASINPDFGQVEVDPAVINLSAYETYYQEKRPFFIEGNNIFREFGRGGVVYNVNINWPNPTLFYSRRIGRSPQGSVNQDGYVKIPDRTTILGAFKLSGKIAEGWNMNLISALTAREYAQIDNLGQRSQQEVEPLTYYGIFRSLKEFQDGHRGFGLLATTVIRDLHSENLASLLNDKAFSLAFDGWTFLDQERNWILSGWLGSTYVHGSREAIYQLQQSSLHYFQRPDASHLELEENATSLFGWGGRIQLNKQKGRTLVNFSLGALSPGFDPNDAGFQFGGSDVINFSFVLGYLWPHPTKITRDAIVAVGPFRSYDFGGNKVWDGILFLAQGKFLNYWRFNTLLAYNPETISKILTRGGPLVKVPYGYEMNLGFSSDNRKPIIFSVSSGLYRRPSIGTYSLSESLGLRWKPRSNFSLSVSPGYSEYLTEYQWVRRVVEPLMTETFGTRYVFARLFQRLLSAEIRFNWIFTPKLSLQAYLQPFLAVGEYSRFKELSRSRSNDYLIYEESEATISLIEEVYSIDPDGEGPASSFSFYNPDFNYKSLRGTIVLRWEYHPGSSLYLVWTQKRSDFSNPGEFSLKRDLSSLFSASGDNVFLLKLTYRWNM
ncbi:carbohydrate binding family 9 domain-containing protein [Candidatus Aminicenantes bacterium AC-334-K16]|jgi:hypothetical protein|nr:carbohydrate binding family 9 domain-containing protein [Candidatus Aminicenantes bacterium AC-334-K16]